MWRVVRWGRKTVQEGGRGRWRSFFCSRTRDFGRDFHRGAFLWLHPATLQLLGMSGFHAGAHHAFTMPRKAAPVLTISVHDARTMPAKEKTPMTGARLRPYQLPDLALLPAVLTNKRHDCLRLAPGGTNPQALGISRAPGLSGFGHWSGALFPRSPLPDHLGLPSPVWSDCR